MAGTARDEAERLVAAVLAMAGSDDRLKDGLEALNDTVSGFLGSLTGTGAGTGGSSTEPDGNSAGGSGTGSGTGSGGSGSSGTGSGSSGTGSAAGGGGAGSDGDGLTGRGAGGGGRDAGGRKADRPGRGFAGHQGWATGSAECCVCPICRVISTMRDPSPETAVKLAIGAGDLATGVASVMRAFSSIMGERTGARTGTGTKPTVARARPENLDENWSAATRTANRPGEAWSAATNRAASAPVRDAKAADQAAVTVAAGEGEAAAKAGVRDAETVDPSAVTAAAAGGKVAGAGGGDSADLSVSAGVVEVAGSSAQGKTDKSDISGPGAPEAGGDPWAVATGVSAAQVAAAHAAEAEVRAARRAAEQAAQREAARAASRRAAEAAARVAEAVRLAEAARELGHSEAGRELGQGEAAREVGRGEGRTPRKRDVWAAATADAGVAAVGGEATLDHDVPGAAAAGERGGAAGDDARGDGAA
jgi:hypothetical protein